MRRLKPVRVAALSLVVPLLSGCYFGNLTIVKEREQAEAQEREAAAARLREQQLAAQQAEAQRRMALLQREAQAAEQRMEQAAAQQRQERERAAAPATETPAVALPVPSGATAAPAEPQPNTAPAPPAFIEDLPNVIYFDTDAFTIKPEYRALLELHARNLKADPNRRLLVRGHADVRGAADYNLALAEKRADTVVKLLGSLGVERARLEPLAYGEQRSAGRDADSVDLARSRRVELIYRP